MKTSPIKTGALALAFLGALALQCIRTPSPVAGGASSTEVGSCGIKGVVVDSLNQPLSGSIIRLRPFDYVSSRESVAVLWANRNVTSDQEGRYKFDTVKTGRYNLEAVYGESLGLVIDVQLDSADTVRILPAAKLQPMVVIQGVNIPFKPNGQKKPSINAVGLEHSATIDSTGNFSMKVPAGWTRLAVEGMDPDAYGIDTLLFTNPGERVDLGPLPPGPGGPCDSLSCELSIVKEILVNSGLANTAPESVVVITQNHVSELHLRSKGLKILSRSVGKLEWLRKLDVGKDSLDTLPSTLDHLRHLEELLADSNGLWKIPANIGMIGELKKLDLSSNRIQSLPEPVTYLRKLVWLDLNDNWLCNIGEMTAQWADRLDPGWRNKQQCQ
jgi:hypothetical protein